MEEYCLHGQEWGCGGGAEWPVCVVTMMADKEGEEGDYRDEWKG